MPHPKWVCALTGWHLPFKFSRMLTGKTLLEEIERFIERSGMSEINFGHFAGDNSKLVARLRGGGTVRLAKAQEIMRYILLQEIDGYLRREQITENRLGELALGERFAVREIRAGGIITPARAEKLLAFIRLPHPAAHASHRPVLTELTEAPEFVPTNGE